MVLWLRIKTVRAISQKTYDKYEHALLLFLNKHQSAMKWLRSGNTSCGMSVSTQKELVELVKQIRTACW